MPSDSKGKSPAIDEKLWTDCQRIVPKSLPARLPHLCGLIDGKVKVILVSGRHIKVKDRPKESSGNHKGDSDFMDFVEGGNGIEDPDLCGRNEIYLDGDHALDDLPPVLYHEAYERRRMIELMKKGMSGPKAYDKAHPEANAQEKQLRLRVLKGER